MRAKSGTSNWRTRSEDDGVAVLVFCFVFENVKRTIAFQTALVSLSNT